MRRELFKIRVGIVGTGTIARGLARLISKRKDMEVSYILTRRKGIIPDLGVSQELITQSIQQVLEHSDILVVSTGDPIYSTAIIDLAFQYGVKVVTMDADTQVLSGTWLSSRGQITEAEGDQPGCLAALREEALQMGFTPLVYGNIKGFLNHNPGFDDMTFWAKKQGFTVNSVTSFTDGTKLQIEQALVANAFGANIAQRGLIGEKTDNLEAGAFHLATIASAQNKVLSDYIISPTAPPGVFLVGTHHNDLAAGLKTYKMGDGPHYLLYKHTHLCYFEIPKTILKFYHTDKVLIDNGRFPTVSVATVAKKRIAAGTLMEKGIGSMEVRGEAMEIAEEPSHVPIGLMSKVHFTRTVEPGQVVTFDDVEINGSLAYKAWQETLLQEEKTF
ncbi:NAD(P)-dependent oxidoreductase [Litoribacter ruber]|uniref:NAD(P)-dependent oxidoreductase n=1 Tax=Litoribacter ruber TaxID=702568 RepID=UPI001BDA1B0C|nr:NAD(P)-dependent oxidoreductase [Litoribacter ruber]MBT0811653.1 NAD(P)-dependent oxidoreductase [Litoribacter ruber]